MPIWGEIFREKGGPDSEWAKVFALTDYLESIRSERGSDAAPCHPSQFEAAGEHAARYDPASRTSRTPPSADPSDPPVALTGSERQR